MIEDRELPEGIRILRQAAKRAGLPTHVLGLVYLRSLDEVLRADVDRAHARYMEIADGEGELPPADYEEMQFWARCFIRSLFLYVDGILFTMRQIVLEAAREGNVSLAERELALMLERAYDGKNQCISDRPQSLGPLKAVKVTTRLFSRTFGGAFAPQFQGPGWSCFRGAYDLRRTVVHPQTMEHIYPSGESMLTLVRGGQWYFLLMADLIGSCSDAIDGSKTT